MTMDLFARFAARAALSPDPSVLDVVNAVHGIAYGRPTRRTIDGVLEQWRGTCSTKHALLSEVLSARWPETEPRLVHRAYCWTPAAAAAMLGPAAAAAVPTRGLWDVHRYLTLAGPTGTVTIDVTFPGMARWDGEHAMQLSCGPGIDFPAGADADADKRALEARYCDPVVREPFIAALSER